MKPSERELTEGILFADHYEFTMAQLYYRMGLCEKPAQFEYFFRSYPDYGSHRSGYCICAGLEWLLDWMLRVRFHRRELEVLRSHQTRSGEQLFAEDFLQWLSQGGDFSSVTMEAVPEGRVVHPNIPLVVVRAPLAMAQLLETSLLNHLNYQTLVATKAARVHEVCDGRMVIEFGMRRAQDRAAGAGARAALIGGADFTSNTGISHVLGLPSKGTHAHSMVQIFMALGEGELGAFQAYADVYPDDCLLLVDTIDTLESGIPNAIKVFERLRRKGHEPMGIRLDSGDLAYLSIQAARMLDQAGFPDTTIVLSNQLDELVIWQILTQIKEEAPKYGVDPDRLLKRLTYGVGTRLITSRGHAALDGVYKLTAVQDEGGWLPAFKVSESLEKAINPGRKDAWRIYDKRGKATADLLSLHEEDPRGQDRLVLRHPSDPDKLRALEKQQISHMQPLLENVLRAGRRSFPPRSIEHIRSVRLSDLERLDPGVKRLVNPHTYHVSVSRQLWQLKQRLIHAEPEESQD